MVTFAIAGFYGDLDLLPFIFPLLAGYTLLGPIVAIGTYELQPTARVWPLHVTDKCILGI
jgi:uncharacterized membrane protein